MEHFFSTAEVAFLTGFDSETILKHAQRGDLKSVRPKGSRERRYSEAAVREWLGGDAEGAVVALVDRRREKMAASRPRRTA